MIEISKKYFPIVLIIFSCCNNRSKEEIPPVQTLALEPVSVFSTFGDSTFLSNRVGAIRKINDTYIISDFGTQQIHVLNKALQLKQTISSYGKGPKEYMDPTGIFLWDSRLYVLSSGTSALKVYEFDEEADQWHCVDHISFTSRGKGKKNSLFIKDSIIYQTSVRDSLVQKSDFNDQLIGGVGHFDMENLARKFMHVVCGEDFYYLIGVSEPVIFKYSYADSLVSQRYYYDHPVFDTSLEYQAETYRQEAHSLVTVIMTSDAFVLKDKLFIIFWDGNKDTKIIDSKIIVVDKNTLQITHLLKLPTRPHYSFCPSIDGNHLISYNSYDAVLEKYNIEDVFD